jgi:inosine-uridine nucleoside N-ribohydrolase
VAIPIIIDTDPGIDDAVAIMLAAASPELRILGITTVAGNTGLEHTSANAAALVDLLRLDVPIGKGAAMPLWRRDTAPNVDVHGANGLGGVRLPASQRTLEPAVPLLVRLIEESPEPVTVIPVGPLTNIALLMTAHPATARKIKRIVLMGGGTRDHVGNATAAAEFNMYFDPDAAARVFSFGVPITMVGLNVTYEALVYNRDFAPLRASGGPIAQLVLGMLGSYGEADYGGQTDKTGDLGLPQHDSLAVASVIRPDLLTTALLPVDVENTGRLTAGMTVVDYRHVSEQPPNVDVALGVDAPGFVKLLISRLVELDTRLKSP